MHIDYCYPLCEARFWQSQGVRKRWETILDQPIATTPPKFNTSTLKNDGTGRHPPFLSGFFVYFQGVFTVKLQEISSIFPIATIFFAENVTYSPQHYQPHRVHQKGKKENPDELSQCSGHFGMVIKNIYIYVYCIY